MSNAFTSIPLQVFSSGFVVRWMLSGKAIVHSERFGGEFIMVIRSGEKSAGKEHRPGDEHGPGLLHDDLQRTLDSVENLVHDTRTQHHRQRLTGTLNRVTNAETGGLLVNLWQARE